MFSGPDSRTAIAWRRIGIPWTRMSPLSAESSEWDEHALRDLPAGSYAMLPGGLPHYNRILLSIGSTEFRADKETGWCLF